MQGTILDALIHSTTWINLKIIMVSEQSQKVHVIPFYKILGNANL